MPALVLHRQNSPVNQLGDKIGVKAVSGSLEPEGRIRSLGNVSHPSFDGLAAVDTSRIKSISLVARACSIMNFIVCAPEPQIRGGCSRAYRSSSTYVFCGSGITRFSTSAESHCSANTRLASGHVHRARKDPNRLGLARRPAPCRPASNT